MLYIQASGSHDAVQITIIVRMKNSSFYKGICFRMIQGCNMQIVFW